MVSPLKPFLLVLNNIVVGGVVYIRITAGLYAMFLWDVGIWILIEYVQVLITKSVRFLYEKTVLNLFYIRAIKIEIITLPDNSRLYRQTVYTKIPKKGGVIVITFS